MVSLLGLAGGRSMEGRVGGGRGREWAGGGAEVERGDGEGATADDGVAAGGGGWRRAPPAGALDLCGRSSPPSPSPPYFPPRTPPPRSPRPTLQKRDKTPHDHAREGGSRRRPHHTSDPPSTQEQHTNAKQKKKYKKTHTKNGDAACARQTESGRRGRVTSRPVPSRPVTSRPAHRAAAAGRRPTGAPGVRKEGWEG